MTEQQITPLYWTEGPFRVALYCNPSTPQYLSTQAFSILEEFRSDCQRRYCAFSGTLNGRALAYKEFKPFLKNRDKTFFVGTGAPDSQQRLGRSMIAQMNQGDFIDSLRAGGKFDDLNAKAFIVMIFHRWDDQFRHGIAQVFSIPKDDVQCDLLGDVRHIRNAIIHENSAIGEKTIDKLKMLPSIWKFKPGKLTITENMLHALMEQINAIRVRIAESP